VTFYAGPGQGALALVESPAQLLNVIELAQLEDDLIGFKIAILAPVAGLTRTQLRSMIPLAREAGHTVSWHEPRLGGLAVARSLRALAGELAGVRRLVVGDPYSGVIQAIISVTKLSEVTIVDDGTATLEFARQWVAGSTFHAGIEWQQPASVGRLPRLLATRFPGLYAAGCQHSLAADCGCSPACPSTYRGSNHPQ
jgi:hypothetical protein